MKKPLISLRLHSRIWGSCKMVISSLAFLILLSFLHSRQAVVHVVIGCKVVHIYTHPRTTLAFTLFMPSFASGLVPWLALYLLSTSLQWKSCCSALEAGHGSLCTEASIYRKSTSLLKTTLIPSWPKAQSSLLSPTHELNKRSLFFFLKIISELRWNATQSPTHFPRQ